MSQVPIYNHIRRILDNTNIEFNEGVNIDIYAVFLMLVTDTLENPVLIKKNKRKYRLVHPGVPNVIYSANCEGFVKGLVMNENTGYLKNCVGMYITSRTKNIHVKLNREKLGIGGDNNDQVIDEITEYIKDRILKMEDMISTIKTQDYNKKTLQWVKRNTIGRSVYVIKNSWSMLNSKDVVVQIDRPGYYVYTVNDLKHSLFQVKVWWKLDSNFYSTVNYSMNKIMLGLRNHSISGLVAVNLRGGIINVTDDDLLYFQQPGLYLLDTPNYEDELKIYEVEILNTLKIPTQFRQTVIESYPKAITDTVTSSPITPYPAGINPKIANYLISHIFDYRDYKTYESTLDSIYTLDHVIRGEIKSYKVKRSMIFTNFYLGFNINLKKLYMEGDGDGFFVVQDDDNSGSVKLQSLCHIPKYLESEVRTNNRGPSVHTFMVCRNGRVAQTSPHQILNQIEHDRFVKYIYSIRSKIENIFCV